MKSHGVLILLVVLTILIIPIANGTRTVKKFCEFETLVQYLRAIDYENVLLDLCSDKLKNVKCSFQANLVVKIRLDKSGFAGLINADSLRKFSRLQGLSLTENRIQGTMQNSIAECKNLVLFLDLNNNLLRLRVSKKKRLEGLTLSSKKARALRSIGVDHEDQSTMDQGNSISESPHDKGIWKHWKVWIMVVIGVGCVLYAAYLLGKKLAKLVKRKEVLESVEESTSKIPLAEASNEVASEQESQISELVFFVEEQERFTLEDLLEATADLRIQSFCSSLYKVGLKNSKVYAVMRLKKLQISLEEFRTIMRTIGELKHENILPLVAYTSTTEDKLLVYKHQNKGSLLNLLEDYVDGKREFKWRLMLSIVAGIARGLNVIYDDQNGQKIVIPHGNIKPSNILIDENEEPLISEFGHSKFLDPNGLGLCSTKGYTAPEKGLNEKSDVFSFGVILLEILTGKLVEKTGIDLPKWVNSMIREEWTGEVFDKRLSKFATQWAFPLLNVALKCVSNSPENRPTFAEVLERIEEVVRAEEDHDMSTLSPSSSTNECYLKDCCHLHTIIPDTWDTPGSNY